MRITISDAAAGISPEPLPSPVSVAGYVRPWKRGQDATAPLGVAPCRITMEIWWGTAPRDRGIVYDGGDGSPAAQGPRGVGGGAKCQYGRDEGVAKP